MPTYQYKCTGCNIIVDRVMGMKENSSSDLVCDICTSAMKRYYAGGAFGVQFNGSGWASKS